ncbi:putative ribonuclease H-like domain-containing protein [Tanacetum coccineum]
MVVQNQSQLGEGLAILTDLHHTPTIIQSSTQPQKTQKPRKPKRKDTQVPQPSDPIENIAYEAVFPTGKDNFIVSAGRPNMVPAGRTIVSPGSIIFGPGTMLNAQPQQQQNIQPQIITTVSNNNVKFPYLKKDEYEVIQNGNNLKRTGRDHDGRVVILPPTTADEHIAVQRESKARTTLLQFGGNAESKKMRKSMLKQEFSEFRISKLEGLHKGYDRMQKILSQLNQLKAKPDDKDINLKFLKGLPSSWSQVALTLKTKSRLELISFDDLYYKLKTLKIDIKGYSTHSSSQSPSHSAFVSTTSTSKKMSYAESPSFSSSTTYSAPSSSKARSHIPSNCFKFSSPLVAKSEPEQQVAMKICKQIDKLDLERDDYQMANGYFAPKEYGMVAGCGAACEEGATEVYSLITGNGTDAAAVEFALMGITAEESELGWDDSEFSIFTSKSEEVEDDTDLAETQMTYVKRSTCLYDSISVSKDRLSLGDNSDKSQFQVPMTMPSVSGKVSIPAARPNQVTAGRPKPVSTGRPKPVSTGKQNRPPLVYVGRRNSSLVTSGWWQSTARPMTHLPTPTSSYFQTSTPFGPHVNLIHMLREEGMVDSVVLRIKTGNKDRLDDFQNAFKVAKANKGYLVGYSVSNKAYRVYNMANKRVEEIMIRAIIRDKANHPAGAEPKDTSDAYTTSDAERLGLGFAKDAEELQTRASAKTENQFHPSSIPVPSLVASIPVPFVITMVLHPSDIGNNVPSHGIFSSVSYDDEFGADLNNLASIVVKYANWTKMILKNKRIRGIVVRNKARLVAQGHRQEEGIDYEEVFAPVYMSLSLRDLWILNILRRSTRRGTIDKTLFLKKHKRDIILWLGLWYLRESPFVLKAYSNSDYAKANKDRKSTTGGCQFLGRRSIGLTTPSEGMDQLNNMNTLFRTFCIERSPELGPTAILATIDETPYTITEDSVRSQLQLADDGGIDDLPIAEIYFGMDNLGYVTEGKLTFYKNKFSPQWRFLVHTILHCLSTKSGSWDQFGSSLAVALICLSDRRKFNWSSHIFKGMVSNIGNAKKFLMYPRFLQTILGIETSVARQYHVFKLSSEGAGVAAQAVLPLIPETIPETRPEPDQPQDHLYTPPRQQTSNPIAQVFEYGQSSDPNIASFSRAYETDDEPFNSTNVEDEPLGGSFHASPPRSTQAPPAGLTSGGAEDLITLTALSSVVSTFVQKVNSLETELKAHKKLFKDVVGKLVKKVKAMEVKLKTKKRKVVVSDSDQEEGGEQALDLDDLIALANAAMTIDSNIPLGGASNNPAASSYIPTDVPTGGDFAPAHSTSPSRDPFKRKGVAKPSSPVSERTKKQLADERLSEIEAARLEALERERSEKEKAEIARQDAIYAKQLEQEVEMSASQRETRQAEVLSSAKHYSDADWIDIMAQVHANAGLSSELLGADVNDDNFAERMVALINQRKRAFAEQTAKEKRDKPMTPAQQREYMRVFVKNQSTTIYSTGWSMKYVKSLTDEQLIAEFEKIRMAVADLKSQELRRTLKRAGEALEPDTSKKQKSTEAPIPSVPDVPQPPVVSSPKSSGTRRKSLGRSRITKPKSILTELDLDADDKTFIKVVSDEDSEYDFLLHSFSRFFYHYSFTFVM